MSLLITILFIVKLCCGSLFYNSSDVFMSCSMPRYYFGTNFANITGTVQIIEDPCKPYVADGNDTLALLNIANNCGIRRAVSNGKNFIAMIVSAGFFLPGSTTRTRYPAVTFPVLDISVSNLREIINTNPQNLSVLILPDHTTWWDIYDNPAFICFQILAMLISASLSGAAIFALYNFVQSKKCKLSVGIVCLIIEASANILRLIGWIDPMNSRYIISESVVVFLFNIPNMFTGFTSLLIALYWFELMKIKKSRQSFLLKYRWVFISIISLMIFIQLIFILLNALSLINPLLSNILTGTIIWISLLISTILLFFAGRTMLRSLQKFNENEIVFNQIRLLLIATVIFTTLYLVFQLSLSPFTTTSLSPIPRLVHFFSNYFHFAISFVKIKTFLIKKETPITLSSEMKNTTQ